MREEEVLFGNKRVPFFSRKDLNFSKLKLVATAFTSHPDKKGKCC